MTDPNDPKLFDKRVSARNIKKGVLDPKEFERHMKSLPDLSDQALPIEATMEPTNVGTGDPPEEE